MPGVTDVAMVDTGVAVRAETFGQCIDAIRAMTVEWDDGPVAGLSDADIVAGAPGRRAAAAGAARQPAGARPIEADFIFYFRSNSALDTNSAIADVRADRATVWAG